MATRDHGGIASHANFTARLEDLVVRLPESEPPSLLVVIDTEEEFDWSAGYRRANTSVTAMREIGAAQAVFDAFHLRPVYVVDQPVAARAEASAELREIHTSGRAEIGAHLHPWVTPPFASGDEVVDARSSYAGNLARPVERAKLRELTLQIERQFGLRPVCYKAGRYGLGPHTPQALLEEGFEVDLSVCPAFDFSGDGGPDYSRCGAEPFWLDSERALLSVPTTGAFVGWSGGAGRSLYGLASHSLAARLKLPSVLSRAGAVDRLMLTPEGYTPPEHRRLVRELLARGVRTFTWSFHSPSLLPGCTPYVRSWAERERLLDDCRRFLDFFLGELGGVARTASELRAHLLRCSAPTVRTEAA